MGIARFTAKDPYAPAATEAEVEEYFTEMSGILDWQIEDNGEVTVEYDSYFVTIDMIEEGLEGLGFELEHIADAPTVETDDVLSDKSAQAPP